MKLVLLSSNYPFGVSGDNAFIQNEIESISNAFDEVVVISTGSGKLREDIPNNVRAISCPINKINIIKLVKAGFSFFNPRVNEAIKELKRFYPKITFPSESLQILKYEYMYQNLKKILIKECIDANLIYSFWMSSRAYSVARLKHKNIIKAPFITRAHRFDLYLYATYLPYRDYISESLDSIFFISESGKEYYEKEIYSKLIHKCNLEVSYLGVNKASTFKEIMGNNKFRIVSCSSIIKVKRLDILIDALSLMDEYVEWIHFGTGNLEKEMKQMAKSKLEGKKNITYKFMGNVENQDLLTYYKNNNVDLFINCSDSEGIPVSIMEAYSFGIPVICRDVGGNKEINCGNNQNYLLDSDAGAKEFANAIRIFMNLSKNEVCKKKKEVTKIFEEKFSKKSILNYVSKLKGIAIKDILEG